MGGSTSTFAEAMATLQKGPRGGAGGNTGTEVVIAESVTRFDTRNG